MKKDSNYKLTLQIRQYLWTCSFAALAETSCDSLARRFSFHPVTLSRCCSKGFQSGLCREIREVKILRGVWLLFGEGYTLKQAAEMVGYADCEYFGSLIRERFGFGFLELKKRYLRIISQL